ncbi:hypothetical protein ABPG74_016556 [Tetrahymena malaccensis]
MEKTHSLGDKQKEAQSVSLWFDMDTGKHYLLNNVTGEKKRVNKTGEYIKKFNVNLTGQVNHDQRVAAANGDAQYMPFKVKSKNYHSQKALYTPQNDKFQGYSQFPCPRTQPYQNQKHEFKLNREKRNFIKKCESLVKFDNTTNSSLFNYGGEKAQNLKVSFISHYQDKDNDLFEKQKQSLLKTLQKHQEIEKQNQRKQEEEDAENKSKQKMKVDDVISQQRYTQKVKSFSQKSFGFNSIAPELQSQFNNHSTLESKKLHSIDTMFSKLEGLQTKTFQKEIKLNFNDHQQSDPNIKTIKEFNQDLEINRLLKDQQLPEIKEKSTVITKGRFGFNLTGDKVLYDADRKIVLKNFPEYFNEKVDTKKQRLKEQRRELLKKVIEEMLIYNEKNKI